MQYTIVTPHPKDFLEEIIQCVKDGEDKSESAIDTWIVQKVRFVTDDGKERIEDVLIHDVPAFKDAGYIRLFVDKEGNSKVYAKFCYWNKFPVVE